MRHPLLVPDLREVIADRDEAALREFFSAHHPTEAAELLEKFNWPGNVRQLRNNVERLMILAGGEPDAVISADMLPQDVGAMVPSMPRGGGEQLMGMPLREAREAFEREYLRAQISRFGGNISRTAEFVGMERSALHRKLKALGMD